MRTLDSLFADNLGIARAAMPQIPDEDKPEFFAQQQSAGFPVTYETVNPLSLLPTQSSVHPDHIASMRRHIADGTYTHSRVIVSSDNRILDGHHHWAISAQDGTPVDIVRIGRPIRDLLAAAHAFDSREHIAEAA